jgi:hypothetical protein
MARVQQTMRRARPLDWHKQCLFNMNENLVYEQRELVRIWDRVQKLKDAIDFLQRQINEAERRGKTEFDRDRFGISRSK